MMFIVGFAAGYAVHKYGVPHLVEFWNNFLGRKP